MRNRTMQNRTNEWRRVEAWKPDEHGVVSLRRTRGGTRPRSAQCVAGAHDVAGRRIVRGTRAAFLDSRCTHQVPMAPAKHESSQPPFLRSWGPFRPATSKFGQILSSSRIWEKRGLKGELAPRAPVLPRFYRYGAQPETLENRYTGAARKRAQRGGARPCATAPASRPLRSDGLHAKCKVNTPVCNVFGVGARRAIVRRTRIYTDRVVLEGRTRGGSFVGAPHSSLQRSSPIEICFNPFVILHFRFTIRNDTSRAASAYANGSPRSCTVLSARRFQPSPRA